MHPLIKSFSPGEIRLIEHMVSLGIDILKIGRGKLLICHDHFINHLGEVDYLFNFKHYEISDEYRLTQTINNIEIPIAIVEVTHSDKVIEHEIIYLVNHQTLKLILAAYYDLQRTSNA